MPAPPREERGKLAASSTLGRTAKLFLQLHVSVACPVNVWLLADVA